MTRTVTAKAVKRVITKGLTGWQAGKLILQDMIDTSFGKDSILTESDMTALRHGRMDGADVRDYNMFMALCRGFHAGHMLGQWVCLDACLGIGSLDHLLQDADKRRTVELFESSGPRVVTRRQYEDIVAAQRKKKLEYEYDLGCVIEERFYAIAPPEARTAIDESGVDIESFEDFVSAVPEQYADLRDQAIDEIRKLHTSAKLPAVYHKKDAKKAKPLLAKWKRGRLLDAAADAVGLDVPDDDGVLAGPNARLGAYIALYNIRLEELKEERRSWESNETRLEKALKMLPAIDVEKVRPSPDSLKQLKGNILEDASGEEWLRTKVRSLECGDDFRFEELLD